MEEDNLIKNTESNLLENGKVYGAVLNGIEPDYEPVTGTNILKMSYKVYINPWQTIEIFNIFKLYDCATYQNRTREKLKLELNKFNFELFDRESRNEFTIARACQHLIGTKVEIQPFNYKGFQKYKVVATERKQILCSFKKLKEEYYDVFGNKSQWRKKQLRRWYGDDIPEIPDETFENHFENLRF